LRAQQSPALESAAAGKSAKAESTRVTESAPAAMPLYGMTATRGARYLLHNGLDYLDYQQYERALKFLREAEMRKKELTDTEKLSLKQGIDRAQRGLREASDAESPYALSERAQRRNGFAPAKPEARLTANSEETKPPIRKPNTNRVASSGLLGSEADDQGEPIRLASGEIPKSDLPSDTSPGASLTKVKTGRSVRKSEADQPANMPEIPQLPAVARLPDLTEASGLEQQRVAAGQTTAAGDQPIAGAPTIARQSATALAETRVQEQVPAPLVRASTPALVATDQEPGQGRQSIPAKPAIASGGDDNRTTQPDLLSTLPPLVPAPEQVVQAPSQAPERAVQAAEPADAKLPLPRSQNAAGVGAGTGMIAETSPAAVPESVTRPVAGPALATVPAQGAQKQPVRALVPPEGAPAFDKVATAPAALVLEMPVPSTTGLAQPSDAGPAPPAARNASVTDLETVPSSTTAGGAPPTVDSSAPAHRETEDANPPAPSRSDVAAQPTQPPDAIAPAPASSGTDDELPPLPANLGRAGPDTHTPDIAAAQPATGPVVDSASTGGEELPPLPADLGRSAAVGPRTDASPVQTADAPLSSPTPPVSQSEKPSQPSESAPVRTPEGPFPPLPIGNEEQPARTAPHGESSQVDDGSTQKPSPAELGTPVTATPAVLDRAAGADTSSTLNNAELPQLSSPNAVSAAAPVSPPSPTTNPNRELQSTVPTGSADQTALDAASLPPAISNQMPSSSSDPFIPDRPNPSSTLSPELKREVEKIAQSQEDELRRQLQNPPQPVVPPRDTIASDLRTQTQLDISRAPSPAEARPIKAIPVPEDWVPLPPRNWSPERKYWAAAATCHLPLYFQDPVLERYGHSVEQFVGPIGRYLTYPVDDPTQSTQRNQLLQPFFSAGLMALQIAAWPYNLIMDPPWEAQYDLGYYRPGDNIPTDTYWLPLHGYGPPLRGSNY